MEPVIAINPVQVDLMIPERRGTTVQGLICRRHIQRDLLCHISGDFSRNLIQVIQIGAQKTKANQLDREAQTIAGPAAAPAVRTGTGGAHPRCQGSP